MTLGNPAPQIENEIHHAPVRAVAGRLVLPLCGLVLAAAVVLLAVAIRSAGHGGHGGAHAGLRAAMIVLAAVGLLGLRGLIRLAPGEAVVLQYLGSYAGTLRAPGLWWVNPATKRRKVSTKIRTHHTVVVKVNDAAGVPVEIAMTLNWRVRDTAQALFAVDAFVEYVTNQCQMALRHVVAGHHYEPQREGDRSLSSSGPEIAEELSRQIAHRVEPARITVIDSQLVHTAYAAEIAQAMLRRQQAAAIVAARQQIIEGAVGMVELALQRLVRENVVDLDDERKATMVSNLLVVLCSDHPTQPMINTGSLYL